MPRDIAGNYTLPAGNPVVPNTIIATNWANTTMQDIADALSASLSIDGSVTTAKIADDAVTPPKLAGLDVNGMVARISATEFEARNIAGTANQISVADADGVAGNPTLSFAANTQILGPVAKVIGDNTGNANVAYLGFYDSDGTTRRGFVGDTANTGDDIVLGADTGDLVLNPFGNKVLPATTSAMDLGSASLTWQHVYAEGIQFPATQVASANANNLDDYEEGTWTPAMNFATQGNLSLVYSSQVGTYTKVGRLVTVTAVMVTTNFTHTTSAGTFRLTGLPFTVGAGNRPAGALQTANFTLNTSRTWAVVVPEAGQTYAEVVDSGSAVASGLWSVTNHTTGDNVVVRYTVAYEV